MSDVLALDEQDEQDEQMLGLALDAAQAGLSYLKALHRMSLLGDNLPLMELRTARLKLYAAARYLDAIIED